MRRHHARIVLLGSDCTRRPVRSQGMRVDRGLANRSVSWSTLKLSAIARSINGSGFNVGWGRATLWPDDGRMEQSVEGSIYMAEFESLVDQFLCEEYEESPVNASGLGLIEYDDRLDDLSADSFERRQSRAAQWRAQFAALPDAELSEDERIDRDLAVSMMTGRTIMADWIAWRRDPVVYSGPITGGLFGLFLHRLRPEPELVEAAIARLAQAPRALEQGRANLDPKLAHPLILERGRDAARGAARYVRDLLPAEAGTTGIGRDSLTPERTLPAPWTTGPLISTSSLATRPAPGSWARNGTPDCSGSERRFPTTPAPCATAAGPNTTASRRRCASCRTEPGPRTTGTPSWSGRTTIIRRRRRRCAGRTPTGRRRPGRSSWRRA